MEKTTDQERDKTAIEKSRLAQTILDGIKEKNGNIHYVNSQDERLELRGISKTRGDFLMKVVPEIKSLYHASTYGELIGVEGVPLQVQNFMISHREYEWQKM